MSLNGVDTLPVVDKKFYQGTLYTVLSVVGMGVSGLAINITLAVFYGAAALGKFNLLLTIYILSSQSASGAFHFSILRYTPLFELEDDRARVLTSALPLSFLSAFIVSLVLILLNRPIASIFHSADLGHGLLLISPAILLCGINKLFTAHINAIKNMALYSLVQFLRPAIIYFVILVALLLRLKMDIIFYSFLISEFLLLVMLLLFKDVLDYLHPRYFTMQWFKKHFQYAKSIYMSSMLFDINPRIDILIIGMFSSGAQIGVYSFISYIAEGFSLFAQALQVNINPLLCQLISKSKFSSIKQIRKENQKKCLFLFTLLGVVAIFSYVVLIKYFIKKEIFYFGGYYLLIFVFGFILQSPWLPFLMILNQAGKAKLYSIYLLIITIANLTLSLTLIQVIGPAGVVIATVIAQLLGLLSLNYFFKQTYGTSL
jgi:O-antigen/teichoic acid export membrane protein